MTASALLFVVEPLNHGVPVLGVDLQQLHQDEAHGTALTLGAGFDEAPHGRVDASQVVADHRPNSHHEGASAPFLIISARPGDDLGGVA